MLYTLTLEDAFQNLTKLLNEVNTHAHNWNEAQTRFHYIDKLLDNCLGWPKHLETTVEDHNDGGYADYILGNPYAAVWEAKREGKHFELPPNPSKRLVQDIPSLIRNDKNLKEAFLQVTEYANKRGIQSAVLCNGPQLIAFIATKLGAPPLEGKCLVISSFEQLEKEFNTIWKCLSRDGILESNLSRLLMTGDTNAIPQKLSSSLHDYPKVRYKSKIHHSLRTIAELLIQEIVTAPEVEKKFYEACYCDSGAISSDALLSKNMLTSRYAALFNPTEETPDLQPISNKKGEIAIDQGLIVESMFSRPIVLIGDVGVGKTSFVQYLKYVAAEEAFRDSIFIEIDLGSKAAFRTELNEFILNEVEEQLKQKYNTNIQAAKFVNGVYNLDKKEFKESIAGELFDSNKEEYQRRLFEMLSRKVDDRPEHIRRSIEHISKARRKQVIIVIDNADQRTLQIQQEAFIAANEFSKHWSAAVFLALRPQTFHESKQSGVLAAYPSKFFTILPPRADKVIERRLRFALSMSEGDIHIPTIENLRLDLKSLTCFLKALIYSLEHNKDLNELLSNITGGNIREVIEYVTKFIGNPNVDADKIIEIVEQSGRYLIPIHEFSKAAILGEYSHYCAKSSLAMNLFDVTQPDVRAHFLASILLSFLNSSGPHQDQDGFVKLTTIVGELQNHGFTKDIIEDCLRRCVNRSLVETSERKTFKEDVLEWAMPTLYRITSRGSYHVKKWIGSFAYLDAMVFDTPIFDEPSVEKLLQNLNSFSLKDRYNRTMLFRQYLSKVWHESNISCTYFDWDHSIETGKSEFDRVAANM